MRIVFTREAKADLDKLRDYLRPLNPQAAKHVVDAIIRAVKLLRDSPRLGHPTGVEDIREFIEPRYFYKLPYWLDDETLYILRVYHPARRPLDYKMMNRPKR